MEEAGLTDFFAGGYCRTMKTLVVVTVLLVASVMRAQTGPTGEMFKTVPKPLSPELLGPPAGPNTIPGLNPTITYSGVIPQAVKTDNPLQLINPFAPAEYGSGMDNLDHDIVTGKENGLKLFSLGF